MNSHLSPLSALLLGLCASSAAADEPLVASPEQGKVRTSLPAYNQPGKQAREGPSSRPAADEAPAAPPDQGEVRVSLPAYSQLVEQAREEPRSAPAAYAIGHAEVEVSVSERDDRVAAQVTATVQVRIFEAQWTLVPILPPGAALTEARVDGRAVQLVQGSDGLGWSTDRPGAATLRLQYGLDARRSDSGLVLPIPVPRAAATRLRLSLPGERLDLAVVPSADLATTEENERTRITASIPPTSSILVSWRVGSKLPYALGRAEYSGELRDGAVSWQARYRVEVFTGELVTLPLMPADTTLTELRVDGTPGTVLVEEGRFATLLQGRGEHEVQVELQTPVLEDEGPPRTVIRIPEVPVSRFTLALPGRKELKISPRASVVEREIEGRTEATAYVPMTEKVELSWVDAVPEDLKTRVRANASVYQAVHAEEGVIHIQGTLIYDITHGETNTLELALPASAQVNRIGAPGGGVADWAVEPGERPGSSRIGVFLDRAAKGELVLEVDYEQLTGSGAGEPIPLALLRAEGVHRQRGMVALLAGPELALEPSSETGMTRVGENQLPAQVRNRLGMSVAHTYKYIAADAALAVKTVAPEHRQGIFDAQVDTLVSIGEVTLKGSATVRIDVKSGSLMALKLRLPENINVLGVSAPSLRSHRVYQDRDQEPPHIELAFTQEMEGQFPVEVLYERIMVSSEAQAPVPTLSVPAAEVEHGRIAVEALAAVEVRAAAAEQLSSVDIAELPRQLVLKTTNPILLAYKYVHTEPPFRLVLEIARHREIEVQTAAIERADYSTLHTPDGLAVTTARFSVRNSRRQFLRLELPPGSEVWSVFVDGKAEKPAHAGGEDGDASAVLIKMINSTAGFPVELVYATQGPAMGFSGRVGGRLPRPDMVATHSRWDLYLPTGFSYWDPEANMSPAGGGGHRGVPHDRPADLAGDERSGATAPLRIRVPAEGVHFAFSKLYANRTDEDAAFSIRFISSTGREIGLWSSLAGVLLVWGGILGLARGRPPLPRALPVAGLLGGILLLGGAIGYLNASPAPASALALAVALGLGVASGIKALGARRKRKREQGEEATGR